ncbi:hypothetical protein [Poseidonocella sp. HB161398]|uniref:hypothetical protein n=1 Tax=Poseidonocella sp. HB161398 TaxID=2320855 RepID=UPI0011098D55|nr:hypothetical protein [Poseidonocella sp. HB161398]
MNRRTALALAASLALMGCTTNIAPEIEGRALGDFSLQHLVVIVDDPQKGPMSRGMDDEALKAAVSGAVETRFRRFQGSGQYSIGIKVVAYALAAPGIPVLLAPRSLLGMNVAVFDADQNRISGDWKQMVVWEDAGGDTVLGSGYTQSAEEQLAELADNAAVEIEKWLRENEDWFAPAAPVAAAGTAEPGA